MPARAAGARGDRGLRRAPRQRHAVELLRRPVGAVHLDRISIRSTRAPGRRSRSGRGAGAGFTVNVPLEAGATDADYERGVPGDRGARARSQFAPELMLVSAGFDAHEDDPLGGACALTGRDELHAARRDARSRRRRPSAATAASVAAMTEGGYDLRRHSAALLATVGRRDAPRRATDGRATPCAAPTVPHQPRRRAPRLPRLAAGASLAADSGRRDNAATHPHSTLCPTTIPRTRQEMAGALGDRRARSRSPTIRRRPKFYCLEMFAYPSATRTSATSATTSSAT